MSKVVLLEQQRRILGVDRAAMLRVCAPAAARRAAVVKEDGRRLTARVSRCHVQSNRHPGFGKFIKNEKGDVERAIRLRP
eukprot:7473367-Pyramimonas_sp.AAC.1